VPGFIQGLYLDAGILGGLNWATGLGLSFFDDNVKVQFTFSHAPIGSRISNYGFGGKVLANVFRRNLSDWFGLDWQSWQTSLALGANFSYFLMDPDDEREFPQVVGQFLAQWEIMKIDMGYFFSGWKYFKSLSLYAEPGIWFYPSAVSSAWNTKFTLGLGMRLSLF
jgi:hypothetical protein